MKYAELMQGLITQTWIETVLMILIALIIMGLVWLGPVVYYKKCKPSKKKKLKKDKKQLITNLVAQSALTLIIVILCCVMVASHFGTVSDMKKDIKENSFVTYNGEYDIERKTAFRKSAFISKLWFDVHPVDIEGTEDRLWFDITQKDLFEDWSGKGTIVYGKHSGYIVSLEEH